MTDEPYDVPADTDVHRCSYCERPFAEQRLLALHRGHDHPDRLDDDELTAFEDAYEDEQADVRQYRILAVGLLVLLYFGLLIVYALI